MDEIPVVTCFLRHDGRVLLMRRADAVGSYPGLWGAVAGHVAADGTDPAAPDRDPLAAAHEEIHEGCGIEDATLVRHAPPFSVEDDELGTRWLVHPFLFDLSSPTVRTDEETAELAWVQPPEIRQLETVPDLWRSYDAVRPRLETVRDDATHGAAVISRRALEVLRDEAALAADGEAPTGAVREGNDWNALASLAEDLRAARPSMAVVANRIDRAMSTAAADATPAAIEEATTRGIERAVAVDDEAATVAARQLPDRVATLSQSGTVRSALLESAPAAILVAESRPGEEGVAVAESLARTLPESDVTLTSDAAMAAELASWGAEALLVGADRILPDGSVVNKVGTRGAALATPADCPVFVVASSDKVATDAHVDTEPRDPAELYDGTAPVAVANPTFDVTPADAVDAVFTERGRLDPGEIASVAAEHRSRADW